jgi:hypothetical protein
MEHKHLYLTTFQHKLLLKKLYDDALSQLNRQRIKIIACAINDKGLPVIADELLTESSPHTAQDLFEEQADADNLSLVTDQAALSDTEKEPSAEPHA